MGGNRSFVITVFVLSAIAAVEVAAQMPRGSGQGNQRRQELEQQLRERTGDMVRARLGLNDEQMRRLQAANRSFEQQRSAHFAREREVRRELREQVLAGDEANQNRVAQLLDQTLVLERQRLEIVQGEQRELAKFLTPVQRAKLLALQQEMRMRAQQLRRNSGQRRGGPPMRRNMRPGS